MRQMEQANEPIMRSLLRPIWSRMIEPVVEANKEAMLATRLDGQLRSRMPEMIVEQAYLMLRREAGVVYPTE